MSDFGVVHEPNTLRFERVLPGPIDRVWAYLTESEKRGTWLASGKMELRVRGRVELHFHHADLSPQLEPTPEQYKEMENGHTNYGHVTRCDPPHLLSFTWAEDSGDYTEVTFELTPLNGDVLLVLTHRRLENMDLMIDVASGWHTHLGILGDRLRHRDPRPFWSTHTKMIMAYEAHFASGKN
ncbi:SRPBCC family protein [Camelliibacillus cellulosilyticus]|uniref:SRPBCC family protein n=1 Tax=Camelliibacillus cellulosilyticus TaxID=2174486 RepID=A0ABV9GMT1_9BACL